MPRILCVCVLALLALPLVAVAADSPPTFEEVKDAGKVTPAPYRVANEELQRMPRTRVVVRIEVQPADEKRRGAALAQALRDALKKEGDAKVGLVFAYAPGDDTEGPYTVGAATASKDGKGWSGDGRLIGTLGGNINDKKGKIFVVLESVLAPSAKPTYLLFPLDPKKS